MIHRMKSMVLPFVVKLFIYYNPMIQTILNVDVFHAQNMQTPTLLLIDADLPVFNLLLHHRRLIRNVSFGNVIKLVFLAMIFLANPLANLIMLFIMVVEILLLIP